MVWKIDDPQGGESQKCKYEIVPYTRGKGIDLGCGPVKTFPHFIGVDSCKDTELFGIAMQPDLVCEDATKLAIPDGDLDFVFSSHLLEHIDDTLAALTEWWRIIKVGGHLVLYLPHANLYPRVGTHGANPDHKHDFVPDDIIDRIIEVCRASDTGVDMLVDEVRNGGMEYSFLQVMRKTARTAGGVRSMNLTVPPKPAGRTACVVRYGGYGDMLQAANILPELRRQGYHVTVMTTPKGQDILREDPHVDAWYIQDNDQVPNQELNAFWAVVSPKFDRFVNLCESVEGTLLAMPGRTNHMWPDSLRRSLLNLNYLEFTARIAELPYKSEAAFYPSHAEETAAMAFVRGFRNSVARGNDLPAMAATPPIFTIMWALSGSSVHKAYPWTDDVVANVLAGMPGAVVVFTGDEACQMLEAGWTDNPRVRCTSGEMGIRSSLALAQRMDCVVGPETGILNAVAFEPMAKVIMLSHSSQENLTKHWRNTTAMVPPKRVACYPCHRLHYGREFCHIDEETHASKCQAAIDPKDVFEAIGRAYETWKEKQHATQ